MNRNAYQVAILFVGAVLLVSVLGIIALAWGAGSGRPVPDILQNIASGALAGLIGLLVHPNDADPGA